MEVAKEPGDRVEVDRQHRTPWCLAELGDRGARPKDARRDDGDIDSAERLYGLRERCADGVRIGDVGDDSLPSWTRETRLDIWRDIESGDGAAAGEQRLDTGAPDPRGGACDQRYGPA